MITMIHRDHRRDIEFGDTAFVCRPASNGGWVVFDEPIEGRFTPIIAAFSNTADLLKGLAAMLAPPPPREEPEGDAS